MAAIDSTAPARRNVLRSDAAQKLLAFAGLIVLFIIFSLASPFFLTFENVVGILLATAVNGVLALGVTYSNAVMIGIPLVQLAWGDAGLVTLLTLIPIHSLVLLTAATVGLEFEHVLAGE